MSETITIRSKPVGDLTARVIIDPFVEGVDSPREWDNLSTLIAWNRDYDLGDGPENNHGSGFTSDYYGVHDLRSHLAGNAPIFLPFRSWETPLGALIELCPEYAGEPHRWTGVAVVSFDDLRTDFLLLDGDKITAEVLAAAVKIVEAEIAILNQYLQGEVYGWQVIDADGAVIDDCYGYIGETDYPMECAIESATAEVAQRAEIAQYEANARAAHWAAHLAVLIEG